ncbi:MAG: HAD family hydrolase [Firmicutes bacterium]|nr:HAD family hydrolase [Bacillota bacterium]
MMKHIIAIDSDGTLRKTDGTISDFTKMVIKKQIEKENIVVICTARPRYHTLKISNEVGINSFMISSNGSEIYDVQKQKIIWAKYIDKKNCKLLYDYAILHNIRIMFVLENIEYVTQFTRNDNQILLTEQNFDEVINSKVKQIMVIGHEKNKINIFKEIVQNEYKMNILDSSKENNEETWFSVVSNEASKGIAVLKLAEYLNISKENIIAIGNDNNDISMFEIAKISAAVSNSTKNALEKATYRIKSNDEDGVAIFLNELNI